MESLPHIIRLGTVDSTNTYIKEHSELWDRQFCAVYAREQTAGRGRHARTWRSEPGLDLTFSVLYVPAGAVAELPCITILAGLAVYRSLRPLLGEDLNLKWPNDIRHGSRKIGGILCETVLTDGRPVVIVGIGVNVNSDHFPDELATTASSIKLITGSDHDPEQIGGKIHKRLASLLAGFTPPLPDDIIREWIGASQSIGSDVFYFRGDITISGTVAGINNDGTLCIRHSDGTTEERFRGELFFPDDEY